MLREDSAHRVYSHILAKIVGGSNPLSGRHGEPSQAGTAGPAQAGAVLAIAAVVIVVAAHVSDVSRES
jgi:hypothetical protein